MKLIVLMLLSILSISCNSQEKTSNTSELANPFEIGIPAPIGQYVVEIYEDSKGHLWFGTLEKGVAKYDGTQLTYYTTQDGLPSNRVVGIIEAANGTLWFGTGAGISKYDGQRFTNFTVKNDFSTNSISQLLIDSKNTFWIGTWGGVYQFDGTTFTAFPIPYPSVTTPINEDTKNWITEIKEDAAGNIWFARDGYGACRYDGANFHHFLKKDGLLSNNVTNIEFDKAGNIWFGTRVGEKDSPDPLRRTGKGGLNKFINNQFLSFPEIDAFNNDDVFEVYIDPSQNIWIGARDNGVYKYDGEQFKNYAVPISITNILRDQKGNLWLGGAGGLYHIDSSESIINVTQIGPWK